MSDHLFLETFNNFQTVQQDAQSWRINQQAPFPTWKSVSIVEKGSYSLVFLLFKQKVG